MTDKQITAQQDYFLDRLIVTNNGAQAARDAGYSERTAKAIANNLLKKPEIQAALERKRAIVARRTKIDQDFVLNGLRENFERAMQHEPACDKDGSTTGEYRYEGNVANRSLELIGKHLGMFTEKHEITGKDGAPLIPAEPNLSNYTTEDLLELKAIHERAKSRIDQQGTGES